MAIYDLKCDDCGWEFEKFTIGFLTESDKECPQCKSANVKQVYTGTFGIGSSCYSGGYGGTSGGFG